MRKNQIKSLDKCKLKDLSSLELDTKEKAYVFGLLNADGYLAPGLWLYTVEDDFKEFKPLLSKVFPTGKYYHRVLQGNRKPQSSVHIYSTHLVNKLKELGFTKKSELMLDYNIKDELIPYYLLGYFDGDGCFFCKKYKQEKDKNFYWVRQFNVSSSYNFDWTYLEKILKDKNIEYRIVRYKYVNSEFSRIVITKKESLKKLINFIYSDFLFPSLQRKKEKAQLILTTL